MTVNCILSGVGGQGTILASKLISLAAMNMGLSVRTAETIGMAQRGGSVVSHVRIGEQIHSPLVPGHAAGIIIGFEPAEAVRCLPCLNKNGIVVVSKKAVMPVTASLGKVSYDSSVMLDYLSKNVKTLLIVDTEKICEECGSAKVLNVALLGAACASGGLGLSLDRMLEAMLELIPPKFFEMNSRALMLGAKSADVSSFGAETSM